MTRRVRCARFLAAAILTVSALSNNDANAQEKDAPKIEVGAQVTSLTLFPPDFLGDVTEPGVGGRVTYNLTDNVAVEGEVNFFPNKNVFAGVGGGRAAQGQFGVKAGKRFDKFGVFAKARPGFLSVGEVFSYEPGASLTIDGFTIPNAKIDRRTNFTMDVGGVLELYPSRKLLVRFDAGDTVVRYGRSFEQDPVNFPQLIERPARYKHNLQITAGVGFRFHDPDPGASDSSGVVAPSSSPSARRAPRYELGVHFTSLSRNQPAAVCFDLCLLPDDRGPQTEPGLGGRFTYNLTNALALEAETSYFTRDLLTIYGPGGHVFQGEFGVKAGKRFRRFGVFGKARPGFVGFTRASILEGTETINFGGFPFEVGRFRTGKQTYFSTDLGGVFELYVSRRLMTRFDVGDTIIRYGEYATPGFFLSRAIVRRPAETRHNLQYTAGIGFRF